MKHNASYNFISQNLKATPCTSVANIHIYFEEMKLKADFLSNFSYLLNLLEIVNILILFPAKFSFKTNMS